MYRCQQPFILGNPEVQPDAQVIKRAREKSIRQHMIPLSLRTAFPYITGTSFPLGWLYNIIIYLLCQ